MAESLIDVEVTQVLRIDIEKEADRLEDCFMDEQICSNYTFGDLEDVDYKRVLVAICKAIIERYED